MATSSVLDFGAAGAPHSERGCKPSLAGLCRIEVKYRNPITLLSATKFAAERFDGQALSELPVERKRSRAILSVSRFHPDPARDLV